MIPLSANEVVRITSGQPIGGRADRQATGVAIDSRAIHQDDCFIAIIGPRDDGHRYAQQAVASGATILLLQRREICDQIVNTTGAAVVLVPDTTAALQALARHVRSVIDPLVVAITGSVGKTTTKTLTHALLAPIRRTHATPGNYNNQWGLPLSLLGLRPGDEWMVAEIGMSAPGEIRALARLARPRIGVITNVAPVHMANFESLAEVAAAKQELAEELPGDGTLIVNADDARTAAVAEAMRGRLGRTLTFGLAAEAAVRAEGLRAAGSGWSLELALPDRDRAPVRLPLPGEHSVANFLAAAAVAHALGITAGDIALRAAGLELPSMRGQIHHTAGGFSVMDDSYNASPTAMMRAIDALAGLPGNGRRILAAGDMLELGSWSEEAHREVGLHAAQSGIDLVVTVGPLARDLGHGARAGGLPDERILAFSTSEDAAPVLGELVRAGDRVLVKGSRAVRMEVVTRALLAAGGSEAGD